MERRARLKQIEDKKRRVEELRARKAARTAAKQSADQSVADTALKSAEEAADELRQYVDSLVASSSEPTPTATHATAVTPSLLQQDEEEDDGKDVERTVVDVREQEEKVSAHVEVYEKWTQTAGLDEERVVENRKVELPLSEEKDDKDEQQTTALQHTRAPTRDAATLHDFVERSSRLVERCLGEQRVFDALREEEHTVAYDEQLERNEEHQERIVNAATFRASRGVSACAFSPHRPDAFISAYTTGSRVLDGLEGKVDVWSMSRSSPERSLGCQSAATACAFSPCEPWLIAAGTRCGQVAYWDLRSASRMPAHRSPLDGRCPHAGAVNFLRVDRDQIITAAEDGTVAAWAPGQLERPVEQDAILDDHKRPWPLSALDGPIDDGDFLGFLAATDDGRLRRVTLFTSTSDRRQLESPHFGCITSLAAHPSARAEASDARLHDANGLRRKLFLSTCFDWSAAVWAADRPILTLDHGPHNYLAHADWSPTNPTLFATAAADGVLRFWTLGSPDPLVPSATFKASNDALNKFAFSHDGRRILLADLGGSLSLLKLDDHLSKSDARRDSKLDDALAANWGSAR